MSFYTQSSVRNTFVAIARTAWNLWKKQGPIAGNSLSNSRALELLASARVYAEEAVPEFDVRNWVRSEGEAAMFWPFRSPTVPGGPYAKLDVGAGTSHASLYRIVAAYVGGTNVKAALAFFGSVAEPTGMDKIDKAIAESIGYTGDHLNFRGIEEEVLRKEAKARGGILDTKEQIYEAYRKAWIQTHLKIKTSQAEIQAWGAHRLFFIGGGSLVSNLVRDFAIHPGTKHAVQLMPIEPPEDLFYLNGSRPTSDVMRFSAVAYGLSNIGMAIPEAHTPDQIPPMPDAQEIRRKIDREDIYAK